MPWLLESSNYFVEVSKDDFDYDLPHTDSVIQEFPTFDETLEFFQKMKVFVQCFHSIDTVIYLFKNNYKSEDGKAYKKGVLLGIQSSLRVESPQTVFLKFVQTPTSDNNNCWQLFPLRRRHDRSNIGGVFLEVPLYWDIRLNEDFSREFVFASIIANDSINKDVSIFWNVGLESRDISTLHAILEDRILCYYEEVHSYYDHGDHHK